MKKSAFDLENQNLAIGNKIVVSLERISQAFRVLLWNESKDFSLSPIQIQVLIFLLHHSYEKRKISYLAEEFNMTKATLSDTIKTLNQKGLIDKEYQKHDNRSYVIHLSDKGKNIAEQTSHFSKQIQVPIDKQDLISQEKLLTSLMDIIQHLNKTGIITIQRMCSTCHFYKENEKGSAHYCGLLKQGLSATELRIDCPEHQPIPVAK